MFSFGYVICGLDVSLYENGISKDPKAYKYLCINKDITPHKHGGATLLKVLLYSIHRNYKFQT